jgi:hypothetical protein
MQRTSVLTPLEQRGRRIANVLMPLLGVAIGFVAALRVGANGWVAGALFLAGQSLFFIWYGFANTQMTPIGNGQVRLHAPWRDATVDLRDGFTLTEMGRKGSQRLLLQAGTTKVWLKAFGDIDAVNEWLRAAKIYGV